MHLAATNITHQLGPRFKLSDITLGLKQGSNGTGSFTAVLGPNGAGKTTLIRILAGLIEPQQGSVHLNGEDLHEISATTRAQHIAYVSQSWRPSFAFTVEQIVLLGRSPYRHRFGGIETTEDYEAAELAISQVGLDGLKNQPVTEISGGELQRVMIAMGLAQGASFLLLDEPTTHLDVAYQQGIMKLLSNLTKETGVEILASMHDLNLASIYSDRVLLLRDGTLTADGPPAEVLQSRLLQDTFGANLAVTDNFYGDRPLVRFCEAPDD